MNTNLFSKIKLKLDESIVYPATFILTNKFNYYRKVHSNGHKQKTILFYPEKPNYHYALYKISHLLGYRISNNPNIPADLVIDFEDTTIKKENPVLLNLQKKQKIINIGCRDISKKKVGEVFKEVFGYDMMIEDPSKYHGVCVKKSDINAKHDGAVIQCPVQPEEGYIYQKLINNKLNKSKVIDLRIYVINDKIPIVGKRFRSLHDRFDHTEWETIVDTNKVLTTDEIAKIIEFSKKFGLEYGELDALRDIDDNKLYIVDVNNTPYGPQRSRHMHKKEYDRLFNILSHTIDTEFFSRES